MDQSKDEQSANGGRDQVDSTRRPPQPLTPPPPAPLNLSPDRLPAQEEQSVNGGRDQVDSARRPPPRKAPPPVPLNLSPDQLPEKDEQSVNGGGDQIDSTRLPPPRKATPPVPLNLSPDQLPEKGLLKGEIVNPMHGLLETDSKDQLSQTMLKSNTCRRVKPDEMEAVQKSLKHCLSEMQQLQAYVKTLQNNSQHPSNPKEQCHSQQETSVQEKKESSIAKKGLRRLSTITLDKEADTIGKVMELLDLPPKKTDDQGKFAVGEKYEKLGIRRLEFMEEVVFWYNEKDARGDANLQVHEQILDCHCNKLLNDKDQQKPKISEGFRIGHVTRIFAGGKVYGIKLIGKVSGRDVFHFKTTSDCLYKLKDIFDLLVEKVMDQKLNERDQKLKEMDTNVHEKGAAAKEYLKESASKVGSNRWVKKSLNWLTDTSLEDQSSRKASQGRQDCEPDCENSTQLLDSMLRFCSWNINLGHMEVLVSNFKDEDFKDISFNSTEKYKYFKINVILWDGLCGMNRCPDQYLAEGLSDEVDYFTKNWIENLDDLSTLDSVYEQSHTLQKMYLMTKVACFYDLRAKKSKMYRGHFIGHKEKWMQEIKKLYAVWPNWNEIFGLPHTNPLNDITCQPLALAVRFEFGDVLVLPEVQDVFSYLWFDDLCEVYEAIKEDFESTKLQFILHKMGRTPHSDHTKVCIRGTLKTSNFYRKVPALYAMTEIVVYICFLCLAYYCVLHDHPHAIDKIFKRHVLLIFLGFGFLFQECRKCATDVNVYFRRMWSWFDAFTLLMFFVYVFHKMRGYGIFSYWVLSVDSIFMLFRILRYLAVTESNGLLVGALMEMIKDVMTFLNIYFLLVLGFAVVMTALFHDAESEEFSYISTTILTLFAATLGDFDFGWFDGHPAEKLGQALLAIFLIVVNILLLNMLIAIISTTYEETEQNSRQKWAILNTQFLMDCQMARGRGTKYCEMTHNLPPPFSVISSLLFPLSNYLRTWDKKHAVQNSTDSADPSCSCSSCLHWLYNSLYYFLDMMVMLTAIMLPAFVCDFTLIFMYLETFVITTYMKTLGAWTKKSTNRCSSNYKLYGETLWAIIKVTLVQVLAVPVLLFVYSCCYPVLFLISLVQNNRKHSKEGEKRKDAQSPSKFSKHQNITKVPTNKPCI